MATTMRLFRTANRSITVAAMYAPLSIMRAYRNERVLLSCVLSKILSALWNNKAMIMVVDSFIAVNAGKLVLTTPARKGLPSTAPK